MEHFDKKTQKEINERKVLFKTYLIKHDTTQKAIAAELGISMTSILRSIERGAFEYGPFAEWWKKNIEYQTQNTTAMDSTNKKETPKIGDKCSNRSSYSNSELHSRLKAIRKTLNLNQDKFAKKLGISQNFLSSIERSDRGISSTVIVALDKIGVNLHWLLSGKGEMFLTDTDEITDSNGHISEAVKLLSELPEEKQKECIGYIKDKKLLLELQKQVENNARTIESNKKSS